MRTFSYRKMSMVTMDKLRTIEVTVTRMVPATDYPQVAKVYQRVHGKYNGVYSQIRLQNCTY